MKILFVSAYDAPRGQSARTHNFARELVAMGHDVTFMTNGFNHFSKKEYLKENEKYRVEEIDGIKVIWLKTFPYHTNGGVARFRNMFSNAWQAYFRSGLIEDSPDIVVGPSVPLFTALSAYLIARKRKAKFIFEIRDVWPQALIDLGYLSDNSLVVKILKKLEAFLYRRADHIVSALPYVYKHITFFGVPKSKISYIPNGVYMEPFKNRSGENEDVNKTLIFKYIGNFSATHGVSVIIECAKRLSELPAKFVLIGASNESLNRLSSELVQYKNISICPVIEKSDVPEELMKSDVLIASVKDTKVYQFGINSNKIYDYLAAGKPIIFAGNTPNNQVLEADAGIVIPPDDVDAMYNAIMLMIEMDIDKRNEMGRKGRVYAEEKLDIKILSKKLIKVFESIIEEKN